MKARSQRARTYQGNNLTNGTVLLVGISDRGDVPSSRHIIRLFRPLVISVRFQFLTRRIDSTLADRRERYRSR